MLELHSSIVGRLDSELEREHGLPLSSYEVLMNLADAEDHRLRMGELARRLLLSRSGITRLADRLERQGLIARERCSEDGRGFFAHLTPAGLEKITAARPTHLAGVREYYLSRLEPQEMDRLAAIWSRLLGAGQTPELDEAAS
jgi:DNA-binding MarR family transcriptional regulator